MAVWTDGAMIYTASQTPRAEFVRTAYGYSTVVVPYHLRDKDLALVIPLKPGQGPPTVTVRYEGKIELDDQGWKQP